MWVVIPVTTTGSNGSASGFEETAAYTGIITAVHVDYGATTPDTTTVTVVEKGGPGRTILTLAASDTDATYYPTVVAQDTTGTPITGATWPFALGGTGIRVNVANANAAAPAVTVFVQILD